MNGVLTMSIDRAFRYNASARYKPGFQQYYDQSIKSNEFTSKLYSDLVNPKVFVSQTAYFQTKYLDVWKNGYQIYFDTEQRANDWETSNFSWYQNQINFAVWLATTGCGISISDHLMQPDSLSRSVFLFHVYYQIRRILFRLKCPLPTYPNFNQYNNSYDKNEYELICNEFNVDSKVAWKSPKLVPPTTSGYYTEPVYSLKPLKISHFCNFMLNVSNGLTQIGVEMLNDSIRAYSWLLLTSQANIRSSIIGVGKELDSQREFILRLEKRISEDINLAKSIADYQDELKFARSKVDYVIGYGLYMIPSNMIWTIGQISDFNNEIQVATSILQLGLNSDVNKSKKIVVTTAEIITPVTNALPITVKTSVKSSFSHDEQKNLIFVGSIVAVALIYFVGM